MELGLHKKLIEMPYPKTRAKAKCFRCGDLVAGHMGKKREICPSEHGHKATESGRFTCSNEGCEHTFTTLTSAHNHSTSVACPQYDGVIAKFPCPNNCGVVFRQKATACNHARSKSCVENPERKADPEYRGMLRHNITDDTKVCSDCKLRKSVSEFGSSKKPETTISYICKRCYGIRAKFNGCRTRAKKEGKVPDFNMEDIKLMVKNTAVCPVFGWELKYNGAQQSRKSATIDAFIHADGHKKSNLRIISYFANTIKNNSTIVEMKQLIDSISSWIAPVIEETPKNKKVHQVLNKGQTSKVCSVCRIDKALDQYSKDPKSKLGICCRCFRCSAVKAMYCNAKNRSGDKIPFRITLQYLHALAKGIEACPILKIPLQYANGKLCDNSATLDKFDVSKGYVPGNVWIISDKANRMKSDATLEELKKVYVYMTSPIP